MRTKAGFLPTLAFSMAFVPAAEITAITVATRDDVGLSAMSNRSQSATTEITGVQDPFSPSSPAAHDGSELIMIDATPVWVHIH